VQAQHPALMLLHQHCWHHWRSRFVLQELLLLPLHMPLLLLLPAAAPLLDSATASHPDSHP
jgi:hypothetical protein